MKRLFATILCLLFVEPTFAATPIRYTVSGDIIKNVAATQLFGNTNQSRPFLISFDADANQFTTISANGAFNFDGAVFVSTVHLIPLSAISHFTSSISGFTLNDFVENTNTNNGSPYSAVIEGEIMTPLAFSFSLSNAMIGDLQVSEYSCWITCTYAPVGNAVDVFQGFGRLANLIYTASPAPSAVPEPQSWLLLLAGLGLTGAVLRRSERKLAASY